MKKTPVEIEVNDLKRILTVKEVCQYLQLSERKIRDMMAFKEIPYAKIGGRARFDRLAIDKWIASQMHRVG